MFHSLNEEHSIKAIEWLTDVDATWSSNWNRTDKVKTLKIIPWHNEFHNWNNFDQIDWSSGGRLQSSLALATLALHFKENNVRVSRLVGKVKQCDEWFSVALCRNELTDLDDDWCKGTKAENIRIRAIVENELRITTGPRVASNVPFIVAKGKLQLVLCNHSKYVIYFNCSVESPTWSQSYMR